MQWEEAFNTVSRLKIHRALDVRDSIILLFRFEGGLPFKFYSKRILFVWFVKLRGTYEYRVDFQMRIFFFF